MCNKNITHDTISPPVQEGRVKPKLKVCPDVTRDPIVIVGAGICGAACALALADLDIKSIILDQRSRHKLMDGAGINLQWGAIEALNSLGVTTASLVQAGNVIQKQSYYCPDGRHICTLDKKSGKGGDDTPGQIAIHRGKLLQLLLDASDSNDSIQLLTQHRVLDVQCSPDKVIVKAEDKQSNSVSFTGSIALGADGIHSNIRKENFIGHTKKKKDPRRYHGITHYRGVANNFPTFLDGKTMIVVGGLHAKVVIYPIGPAKEGKQTINWIVCIKEEKSNCASSSNPDYILDILSCHEFRLDFLDLESLIQSTSSIQAWPMIDLDPLETWAQSRIALTGDAAHGMLPVGSGGAMSGLFDALALRDAFLRSGPVPAPDVLRLYQSMRYKAASNHQQHCRLQPAEKIVEEVLTRVPKLSKVPSEYAERIRKEMKKLQCSPPRVSEDVNDAIQKRVLIVGAGASGLATCKEFQECGYTPIVFESGGTFGGVFRDAYEKLQLTSSSVFTAFSDYPPNLDEPPTMWTGPEYLSYLHRYTVDNNIFKNIQFNSKVIGIRRIKMDSGIEEHGDHTDNMIWEVSVYDSISKETSCIKGCIVALCVGSNAKPSKPIFPGQESFSGKIIHTSEVDTYEMFQGKRVLSLGIGESGSDVPFWIAKEPGTKLTVAARGLGWCVPRRRPLGSGLPTDLNTNRLFWGLPRIFNRVSSFLMAFLDSRFDSDPLIRRMGKLNLKHPAGIYRTYGTKSINFLVAIEKLGSNFVQSGISSMGPGNRVEFYDGTVGEFDILLLNTGYQRSNFEGFCSFPSSTEDDHDTILRQVLSEASYVRNLYKRIVHPAVDKLYFIGFARPGFASIPTIAETQARWVASLTSGRCKPLPKEKDMIAAIAVDKFLEEKQFGGAAGRVTTLVDYVPYINDIASLLGATPPYLRLLFSNPYLLLRIFTGPATVAQFRLQGPGAKPQIARATIESYPLPLKRRLYYVSLSLYLMSLLILLLSLGLPLTSTTRKKLQPVGFPPLRSRFLLYSRYILGCCHLFSLGYLYSSLTGTPAVGMAFVAATSLLEGREFLRGKRNEMKVRETLTSHAEASKLNQCSKCQPALYSNKKYIKASTNITMLVAMFFLTAVLVGKGPGKFFVSAFKVGGTSPYNKSRNGSTSTNIGSSFDKHFKKIEGLSSIERVILSANGNMQRIVSAYHNKPVNVSVLHFEGIDRHVDHDAEVLAAYKREVEIKLVDSTFCRAYSIVNVRSPEVLELLASKPIGIGQLIHLLNLHPKFTLNDVGRNGDGGIWRHYTLDCEGMFSCNIHETFSLHAWNIASE